MFTPTHSRFVPFIILLFPHIVHSQPSMGVTDTGWTVQNSGTAPLYGVKAVSRYVAWAGGSVGRAVRTTDGGETWFLTSPVSTDPIYTITAASEDAAMVGTFSSFAKIWRTTNGGSTWIPTDSIASSFPDYVHMFNAGKAIWWGDPVGGNWVLRKTTNGGETWINAASLSAFPTEAGWSNSMTWCDSLRGWFGTNSSHLYRTTDGGSSWTSYSIGPTNVYTVWFNDSTTGLAASGNQLWRSTNGGMAWIQLLNAPADVRSLSGRKGSSEYWFASTTVYYSADTGNSWTNQPPHGYPSGGGVHMSMVTIGESVYGWVVGSGTLILHYGRTVPTALRDGEVDLPQEILLAQNYPNPFNPSTHIQYRLPQSLHVRLSVYDVTGREISRLVDRREQAGEHDVVFEAKGLASGVYLYRLEADDLRQTRKMVLIH